MERRHNRDITAIREAATESRQLLPSASLLRGGLDVKVSWIDLIIFLLLALFGGDRNDKTPRG
jgi:hypothetical protein